MNYLKTILQNDSFKRLRNYTRQYFQPIIQSFTQKYLWLRERHPLLARVLLYSGVSLSALIILVFLFLLFVSLGVFGRMPSKNDLRNLNQNIASEIYSEDGILLGKFFIENRLPTDLDSISPYVRNALIATEDVRFFEHGGVDMRATFRVLYRTLLSGDESGGGGSTISQQLAKNLYPRKNFGKLTIPIAKIREIIIARKLEKVYNKEEILALYLNTVPFGENVFGIRTAAERFFSTTPFHIKPEEAAILIGMLKANTTYNPVRYPERAKERRNVVLSLMVKNNFLDAAIADSLSKLPVVVKYHVESHNEGMATYFREHLRLELEKELKKYTHPDGRSYNLYTDGLKIYTTINSRIQQYAEESVKEYMKELQKAFIQHFKGYAGAVPYGSEELLLTQKKASERYKILKGKGWSEEAIDSNFKTPVRMTIFNWETPDQDKDTLLSPLDSLKYHLSLLHAGLLATESATGKILAWVGGINFKHFKYDHVKALRQVGSTFKPFVYAKAIEKGIPPCRRFPNEFRIYPQFDNWAPRNSDGVYGGSYSMRGGMRMSVNTTAVQLILHDSVGIDTVRVFAKRMGISSNIPHEPGIALGAVDATLYEMVRAFSVFANRGILPELHCVTRIETSDGRTVAEFKAPDPANFPRLLREQHADMVRYLLQSVVDGGTGGRLRYQSNFPYPAAGKTGTTDNNSDGWFIGFTPDLVTGVWIGAAQPLVRWRSTRIGQGGATALPLCGKFWVKVYADSTFQQWRNHNFPPLTGTAAGAFNCPDFIPSYESILDSIAYYETIPADSIEEDLRLFHLERLRQKLIRSGYISQDSVNRDSVVRLELEN